MLLAKMAMLAAVLGLGACAAIAPTPVSTSQAHDAVLEQAAEPPAVITAGPVGYGGRLMQPSRLP
jgi:hypothetical protein